MHGTNAEAVARAVGRLYERCADCRRGAFHVQWSVDSLDWQGLEVAEMVKRVTGAAENGSIILFHNDVKNTPEALRQILAVLSEKGYSFVTVEELIYTEHYRIDATGKQYALTGDA